MWNNRAEAEAWDRAGALFEAHEAAATRASRPFLGDILVRNGVLTPEALDIALAQGRATQRRLGEILLDLNLARSSDVLAAVAEQSGVEYVDLEVTSPDPDVITSIPPALARRTKAVPMWRTSDGTVKVAMANPTDILAVDDIRIAVGSRIVPMLADLSRLDMVLNNLGGVERAVTEALQRAVDETASAAPSGPVMEVSEAPLVQFVDYLLTLAMNERASDVHIEPSDEDTRIRFRVDSVLRDAISAPKNLHAALVNRIKVSAEINISERRLPQDGRMSLRLRNGQSADMRVATIPTVLGEAVAIRLIVEDKRAAQLETLGFFPEALERLKQSVFLPHGAMLVTGPTGSGKTTTLYAALQELNDSTRNILTVEDPVESRIAGIKQVQVNPKAGLSFASALRTFLRADPDVVLVGEIRDLETATIAVEASMTGHRVLSSLHTNDAASTPPRLIEMGVAPYYVISSLNCVVAQRLVRTLCENCKEESQATELELHSLVIPEVVRNSDGSFSLYRPRGCATCSSTGYRGRCAVQEVMVVDDNIRALIADRAPSAAIKEAAIEAGMWTLREDGLRKVSAGLTSLQEIMRAVM
jgi:type IV pilus assembly protein PilB